MQCAPLCETSPFGEASGPEYWPFAIGSLYIPYSLLKSFWGINLFFLVNEKMAGSKERAWAVSVQLAEKLSSGAITEEHLVRERGELCAALEPT